MTRYCCGGMIGERLKVRDTAEAARASGVKGDQAFTETAHRQGTGRVSLEFPGFILGSKNLRAREVWNKTAQLIPRPLL